MQHSGARFGTLRHNFPLLTRIISGRANKIVGQTCTLRVGSRSRTTRTYSQSRHKAVTRRFEADSGRFEALGGTARRVVRDARMNCKLNVIHIAIIILVQSLARLQPVTVIVSVDAPCLILLL